MSSFGTGKRDPKSGGLRDIEVRSGVNEQGEPFCTVIALAASGGVALQGQITPAEVRAMALDWLGAAEAAEQDAVVYRLLGNVGLDHQAIGAFIGDMRRERGGQR